MKTFCGCMSTKSGSLTIIGLGILVYVACIVFASIRLTDGSVGWIEEQISVPTECQPANPPADGGDKADTWWCQAIANIQKVEEDVAIIKISVNAVLLVSSLLGLYGATIDNSCLILPYIVLEFLQLLGFAGVIATVVLVLGVYAPGGVELSTTISVAVIGVMFLVILFYLWLCVVSLYQTLREIRHLGSDQVKIMQFQEDTQPYNKFGTSDPDYDPHSDDYPVGNGLDLEGPPSYRPPSSMAPVAPLQDAKVVDLVE